MSVLPEFFDPNMFVQPDFDSHFTIKRPYTTFSKVMTVKFDDYKVSLYLTLSLIINFNYFLLTLFKY